MVAVFFSLSAIADLETIHRYIAKDSIFFADSVTDKIINRTALLENHPKMGRVVPELQNSQIREIFEGVYRIINEIESDSEITILRIFHQSRLLEEL